MIIGGGVAGYVAAIKAGQEGLKVRTELPKVEKYSNRLDRLPALKNEVLWEVLV